MIASVLSHLLPVDWSPPLTAPAPLRAAESRAVVRSASSGSCDCGGVGRVSVRDSTGRHWVDCECVT